jgi:hypothetical protein
MAGPFSQLGAAVNRKPNTKNGKKPNSIHQTCSAGPGMPPGARPAPPARRLSMSSSHQSMTSTPCMTPGRNMTRWGAAV